MWGRLLSAYLARLIQVGSLEVTFPDGTRRDHGPGGQGPRVALAITDTGTLRRLALNPHLELGEAYTDARLTIEGDDLHGLLELALRNIAAGHDSRLNAAMWWVRDRFRWISQRNPATRARRNVAHHYDLSGGLYDLFLDADRQYSCAYFKDPADTLEQAQAQKKAHIAAKLCLKPGMKVLDIGCGWGGMALTLARDFGVEVLGVTLSSEQLAMARTRAEAAGLAGQVRFDLTDYRAVQGRFDRVVSVGMFEHVGVPQYLTYFRKVRDLLTADGVALIHTIGRAAPPGSTNPWIAKYIFPGGYIPALSETMAAIERSGLVQTDVEIWRLHYAMTLRHWHDRFMARRDQAAALYDERFVRMWKFYLAASEQVFRHAGQCVFQIQLARDQAAVPLTRDYLHVPSSAAFPLAGA